jgi:sugar phosphate isomerase/epimerase
MDRPAQEDWKEIMWKYCICAAHGAEIHEPVLFRGRPEESFSYARDLGYDGVELHLRDAADVDGDELRRQSDKCGVAVAAIATGLAKRVDGLSLVDDDETQRQAAINRVRGHLDLAAQFGCPVIIGSMRGNIPSPDRREWIMARLANALRQISEYIQEKDCYVLLEAINRYENNYLNTSAETMAFVEHIGSPKIHLLLDSYHMNIEERDNADAIRVAGARLGHFHISENTRLYPGHGQVDFTKILKALRDIKYAGWLGMEYLPKPNELEASRKGIEFARWVQKEFA